MGSWTEFDTRRRQRTAEAAPLLNDTAADVCARIFSGPDGKELLRHLYAVTVDQRCRAGATDAELREAEAQRRLVATLENWRDEGLERAKARSQAASH